VDFVCANSVGVGKVKGSVIHNFLYFSYSICCIIMPFEGY
jgi:hypothetical protein